jgi:hypothetical protein
MDKAQCPYDPNDCPKIRELRRIVERNESDIKEIHESVVRLETTIKTATKVMIVLATILAGALGLNITEILTIASGGV